jgi:hypothetical protein
VRHENSYQIAIKSIFCPKCRIASYNTQEAICRSIFVFEVHHITVCDSQRESNTIFLQVYVFEKSFGIGFDRALNFFVAVVVLAVENILVFTPSESKLFTFAVIYVVSYASSSWRRSWLCSSKRDHLSNPRAIEPVRFARDFGMCRSKCRQITS